MFYMFYRFYSLAFFLCEIRGVGVTSNLCHRTLQKQSDMHKIFNASVISMKLQNASYKHKGMFFSGS